MPEKMDQLSAGDGVGPLMERDYSAVIVGSSLFKGGTVDVLLAERMSGAVGRESVIAAVDSRGGRVVIDGWRTALPIAPADAVRALNDNTLVVCMIETPEGLANVDAIAAVPGVDVIHVGSSDLLTAMGTPGAYGTPEHLAALDKVMAAAKKHGKIAGVGGDRNIPRQVEFIRKGARFLTTNSDVAFVIAEGTRVTGELRKALEAR